MLIGTTYTVAWLCFITEA